VGQPRPPSSATMPLSPPFPAPRGPPPRQGGLWVQFLTNPIPFPQERLGMGESLLHKLFRPLLSRHALVAGRACLGPGPWWDVGQEQPHSFPGFESLPRQHPACLPAFPSGCPREQRHPPHKIARCPIQGRSGSLDPVHTLPVYEAPTTAQSWRQRQKSVLRVAAVKNRRLAAYACAP
jgi:hypothetical protein